MAFGFKKPEIKTKRENFADALAKYREEEAILNKSLSDLRVKVADLIFQADSYDKLVSHSKQRLADLNSEIGLAETKIQDKQKEHLVWVNSALITESNKLAALIASNEERAADLTVAENSAKVRSEVLAQDKSLLDGSFAELKKDKEDFNDERTKERLAAIEDRRKLDVLVAEYKELVRVLAEREKNSRPIPKPITLQKRRRLK